MIGSPRGSAPGHVVVVAVLVAALTVSFRTAASAQEPAPGGPVHVDTLVTASSAVPAIAPPASPVATTPSASSSPPTNLLPFADNHVPARYPAVGLSVGVAAYLSSLHGFEQAFQAIEDSIESGGFAVSSGSAIDPGPVALFTLDVALAPSLDIACQVGRSRRDDNELRLIGGLVSGRYTPGAAPNVSVLAGLGGGAYGFTFQKKYGQQISATDSNGGYTALDHIRLEGGGGYWTAAGRLAVRTDPNIVFEGLAQYIGANDVSMSAGSAGKVSANISGTMLGVSMLILF